MTALSLRLQALVNDRRGVTVVEYGLIAAIMATLLVTAFQTLWSPLSPSFAIIGSFLVSTASAGF
jgi:pilus assembly protein Flp/PilA